MNSGNRFPTPATNQTRFNTGISTPVRPDTLRIKVYLLKMVGYPFPPPMGGNQSNHLPVGEGYFHQLAGNAIGNVGFYPGQNYGANGSGWQNFQTPMPDLQQPVPIIFFSKSQNRFYSLQPAPTPIFTNNGQWHENFAHDGTTGTIYLSYPWQLGQIIP